MFLLKRKQRRQDTDREANTASRSRTERRGEPANVQRESSRKPEDYMQEISRYLAGARPV